MNNRDKLIDLLNNCADISDENFYIWGAGNTTELNYSVIENEKLIPTAFIDKSKTGKFHGIDIISPDDIAGAGAVTVLISSAVPRVIESIKNNIKSVNSAAGYYTIDEIILGRHAEEIIKVYDLMETEESRKTYYELIKSRIEGVMSPEVEISSNEYYYPDRFRNRNKNEVFVDCGAFVGDTVEQYLFCKGGTFKGIVAIEPDERNIKLLNRRVERLRGEWCTEDSYIDVIYGAIGKNEGEVGIDSSIESLSAKVSEAETDNKVKMYTIDALFKEKNVGFIKADIEGYEMDMLESAKETILRDRPLLAICVYHKTSDMYEVPLFINKLNPDYKFEIAQHYHDLIDTVLYAYV